MSVVNVTRIEVLNNPCQLLDAFSFLVTFESVEDLNEDIEWKLTWVNEDQTADIELDCVCVGPIRRGPMRFKFCAQPPAFEKMDLDEVLGMSALLLTGIYNDEEFVRIGWYVQTFYIDPTVNLEPPAVPVWSSLKRCVLSDEPRLTKFGIRWDSPRDEFP
eukprot:GHVH01004092.1.p1 GENE.GHVH01004092.1~~GHVH01004092.1.p1  ORF type:complete len:160 (+),score=23.05 GHVH01004092.1:120-599(+)